MQRQMIKLVDQKPVQIAEGLKSNVSKKNMIRHADDAKPKDYNVCTSIKLQVTKLPMDQKVALIKIN